MVGAEGLGVGSDSEDGGAEEEESPILDAGSTGRASCSALVSMVQEWVGERVLCVRIYVEE